MRIKLLALVACAGAVLPAHASADEEGLSFVPAEAKPIVLEPKDGGREGELQLVLKNSSGYAGELAVKLLRSDRNVTVGLGPASDPFPDRWRRARDTGAAALKIERGAARRLVVAVRTGRDPRKPLPAGTLVASAVDAAVTPAALAITTQTDVDRFAATDPQPASVTIVAAHCLPAIFRFIRSCKGDADVDLREVAAGGALKKDDSIASTRLASDSGGTADVAVRTGEEISAGAVETVDGQVKADEITKSGMYAGDLTLDDAEKQKLSISLKARDSFLPADRGLRRRGDRLVVCVAARTEPSAGDPAGNPRRGR